MIKAWSICMVAALFYSYEYLLRIMPGIMVPELMQSFDISATALGNLSAFYYYAYTPLQLPVGTIMDRFGARVVLTLAVLCCTLGSMLFGSATVIEWAAVGRFFVGFGSAFAFVGVLKLAAEWLPANRFGLVVGLASSLGMVGAIFGQLFLSHLVSRVGWMQTIEYSSLLGWGILLLVWFLIRDKSYPEEEQGLRSWSVLARHVWTLFFSRQLLLAGAVGCLLYLPLTILGELWGVPFLMAEYAFDREQAVEIISMNTMGWAIGGPIMGWLSDYFGCRKSPLCLSSLLATIFAGSILWLHSSAQWLMVLFFLFGFFSSAQILCFAISRDSSPLVFAGSSVAVTNFLVMIGGIFFLPLIGWFLDIQWQGEYVEGARFFTGADYQYALGVIPLCLALATALIFWGVEGKKNHDVSTKEA